MVETQSLIAAEQWFELRSQTQDLSLVDDATWRARAELAAVRRGPVCDAVVAARRALRAGWSDAPHYVRIAVRALVPLGASPLARELLDQASSARDVESDFALLRRQLDEGAVHGLSVHAHDAQLALAQGDLVAARRGFDAAAARGARADRLEALRMLAQLGRHDGDFAAARHAHRLAHDVLPEADRAHTFALAAALDTWVCGDAAAALAALRTVRALEAAEGSPAFWAARRAERLLQVFERDPDAACVWRRSELGSTRASAGGAAGVLELVARWLTREAPQVPDGHERLAHVRRSLVTMGVACLRLRATPANVRAALEQGALVVLEEERPVGHALTLVAGYDEQTELVAIREPDDWGAELVLWQEQARSMEVLSSSALVVLGVDDMAETRRAALASRGVAHEPLFDALDACEVDADGEVPPFAETLAIARQVLERDPSCQLARKRGADALLYGYRVGRVPDEELLGWLAAAREQEPGAEWPHQTYASWLAAERHTGEAAVAWAAARMADPQDFRNPLGEANALINLDRLDLAEPLLRDAAALCGASANIAVWLTRTALARDALELADACASVSTALAPDDASTWSVHASVLEATGRDDAALAALERADGLSEGDDAHLALRLVRRRAASGGFAAAEERVQQLTAEAANTPADALLHAQLAEARLRVSQGDVEGAQTVLARALARSGPNVELLTSVSYVLALGARDDDTFAARWVSLVEPQLADELRSWSDALLTLSRAGRHTLAKTRLGALEPASNRLSERAWIEARTWLYSGVYERAPIVEQLTTVVETVPGFEAPRLLLALQLADTDPERALSVTGVDVGASFVAGVWFARARAQRRLGRTGEAEALRTRLGQLPGNLLTATIGYLRTAHQLDAADELLALALSAHPGDADLQRENVQLAWQSGQTSKAATALRDLQSRREAFDTDVARRVATAAGDWELLGEVAEVGLDGLRDSRIEADPWLLEAAFAGAALARGDEQPRARCLSLAGRHVSALALLAHVEQRLPGTTPVALARLREVSDLADHLLQRTEVL